MDQTLQLVPGNIVDDRYEVLMPADINHMGTEYLVRDKANGSNVLLRALTTYITGASARLKVYTDFVNSQSSLQHPGLVTTDRIFSYKGVRFSVMNHTAVQSLRDVIKASEMALPKQLVLSHVRKLAELIGYLHDKGFVDGALSLHHLSFDNDRLYIRDFGAYAAMWQRTEADSLFEPGLVGATRPSYASLEAMLGEAPCMQDDIYGFGWLAYQLLSGQLPYDRNTADRALDLDLPLARIEWLDKKQWQALAACLALRKCNRTSAIESFLDAF